MDHYGHHSSSRDDAAAGTLTSWLKRVPERGGIKGGAGAGQVQKLPLHTLRRAPSSPALALDTRNS